MEDNFVASSFTDSSGKETFRSQQSLGLITQRFMSLRQKNEVMNLNQVVQELNIPKRRVYDVINVLEGLGYIQKIEKNNIKWIGDANQSDSQDLLEAGVEKLRQQERILELMLRDAQSVLRLHFEDPISRSYNYIRKNEIRNTSSPDLKSIIVKSDVDASNAFDVQVSDSPTSQESYGMIIRNKKGVRSHALLFSHNMPDEEASTSDSVKTELNEEDVEMDDLERFIIPTSSAASTTQYTPETPGRGLLISPFKNLIDPTCILPSFCEDHGYIQIATPSESQGEVREEASVMQLLYD